MNLVSVIVPCYNMSAFLEETLQSVCASDYPNFEVLVIDDGSTDDSLARAQSFASRDPRVRVLTQPNSGVCAARNLGLQQARGVYVLPVDADDLISPRFISQAVAAMDANPALKVVYPRAAFFGERSGEWMLPPYCPKLLARKNMIPATALYRRADALAFGGYCTDELFREDWDFWLSMLENGGEVLQLEELGFFYRVRSGSRRSLAAKNKRKMVDALNRRHTAYFQRYLGGPLHYHRSWSRFLNFFRCEKTVGPISPISPSSPIIHSGRNTLYEQDDLVIKAFAKPRLLKALIYGLLIKSKARRSYEYAERLLNAGVHTPDPVAYKEVRVCGLLRESYFVSRKSSCPHTFNELINNSQPAILSSIGEFTARMHEAGALHGDYSGGNILFDDNGHVEVVDLNRIHWKPLIDWRMGCKNFERLNINREALTVMATAYAQARGFDADECADYIIRHRWKKHVRQGITNLQ